MSIPLNSIDCPSLTSECLALLVEHYSIRTTNDFVLWLTKSLDKNHHLSSQTIECIQSCIIAHSAQIQNRNISTSNSSFKLNHLLFDDENLLQTKRHLLFIYEYFNQSQWNRFFNIFLLRLFLENKSIRIQYINTNISLFDLTYFYTHYCSLNEKIFLERNNLFEQFFYFNQCFDLETFENQLKFMENNEDFIHILIIDDFFSLIKPYLSLDRRIKGKVLQLTYRLNRLAQRQSMLIINGFIFNTKQRTKKFEDNSLMQDEIRFDSFHADKYILLQSLTPIEKHISVRILNEKKQSNISRLDLDEWINGEFPEEKTSSYSMRY